MSEEENNSHPEKHCGHHNHSHSHESGCCKSTPNPSLCQNLDEMEFERGIWQAAIDDDAEKITHLISYQKVSPDLQDSYGFTALHYAARNGKLKAAKCLVKFGAGLNCQTRNNGTTPLHRAIIAKKSEMVQYLLECGASLTIKDNDGHTPLGKAMMEGDESIINIVKKFG